MTQFVRGALTRARRAGSKIIFVTCDPRTELQTFVDLTIAPAVGPEVIAGSTRLKAGTATKIVLNMLTTASMIRIGKTYGNLMVDVQMGSEKLQAIAPAASSPSSPASSTTRPTSCCGARTGTSRPRS